jgi:TnpA family transposase
MESIGKAAHIDLPRKFAPAKHQTRKPTLKHFASIWTLMDYPKGSASGE